MRSVPPSDTVCDPAGMAREKGTIVANSATVLVGRDRWRNAAIVLLALCVLAKVVSLFLPVFAASGRVLDTDLALMDVAPLTVGILVSIVLDVVAAVMIWRERPWPVWLAFVVACGGAATFALGETLGDFLAKIVAVGPVNEYQNLEVGIGVFVLFLVYLAEVLLLPVVGLVLMRSGRSGGAGRAPGSTPAPVFADVPVGYGVSDAMRPNGMPSSLSIFGEDD